MPQNVLELGLKRSQETNLITSVHGTVYRSDGRVRRFLRTILPASTRIRTLSINVFERGSGDLIKSLWTNCPNVESLQLAGKPESVLTHSTKDSAAEVGCPTPRWLHINTSDVPQIPTLYARVEELLIESPTSLLEARVLQMIFKSAPNLRIIRLDQMDETQLEDPDVAADEPRVVAPDLKLLEILNSDWEKILWVLNRFQWSPSTSLKIQTWNGFIDHLCGDEVRAHVHAILRSMTDSSFGLDISTWSYRLQTREVSVEIELARGEPFEGWPNFFKDFEARPGQAPIRYYVFLRLTDDVPEDLLIEECIKGLQNDYFVMM